MKLHKLIILLSLSFNSMALQKPNILWIVSEDNSANWLGVYGNKNATTPNLDKLAGEGFTYTQCYSNAAVCAPSRSTWITGIHAVSMGTQPMRSHYPIPHDQISYFPDHLKKNGYYVSNHFKTDYNIGGRDDFDCWDNDKNDSQNIYGWRKAPKGKAFFCQINIHDSHESQAFGLIDQTRHDPKQIRPFKYHPNTKVMRQNYARYLDKIEDMDRQVGNILKELKKDGLENNTIVIYSSDHGGVMFRSKRFIYNSGTHCPLILRIPPKYKELWPTQKPGSVIHRLVSFVDMPKTWLSISQSAIPANFQGRIFLGPNTEPEAPFHFSFRERADERIDNARMIRDKEFIYIKNYLPFVPTGQNLMYPNIMKATQEWRKQHQQGLTDSITGRIFSAKDSDELYDSNKDYDNINNLAKDEPYSQKLKELKQAMREYQLEIFDSGLLPESERLRLAQKHKMTIYELIRKPELYNLPALLDAADFAISAKNSDQVQLCDMLNSQDLGIRYWATTAFCRLNNLNKPSISKLKHCLSDESHEVRIYAAYALIKNGHSEEAYQCLRTLFDQKSYARLTLLNAIDWLKIGKQFIDEIKAMDTDCNYEQDMRSLIFKNNGLPYDSNWAQNKYQRLEAEAISKRDSRP